MIFYRKAAIFILICSIFAMLLTTGYSVAATAPATSARIVTDENIEQGKNFKVSIEYDGEKLARIQGKLNYDADMLELRNAGEHKENKKGEISFLEKRVDTKDFNLQFDFKPKMGGDTKIKVDTDSAVTSDEESTGIGSVEKKITITGTTENKIKNRSVNERYVNNEEISTDNQNYADYLPRVVPDPYIIYIVALAAVLILLFLVTILTRAKKKG